MKKILLLTIFLISCGDVDNLDNLRQAACADDSSKCEGTSWSIRIQSVTLPSRIRMKINNTTVLDECSNSQAPFRVSRNNITEIYTSDYEAPTPNKFNLEIFDRGISCNLNRIFHQNTNQPFEITNYKVKITI